MILLFILFISNAFAVGEVSQSFSLDGQFYDSPAGTAPLLDPTLRVRIQILDDAQECVLYDQRVTIDTDATNGYFSIDVGSEVGSPVRVAGSDPGNTMVEVFQNVRNIPGRSCAGNLSQAVANSGRYLRITVTPTATNTSDILSPDIYIGSVPSALVSQTLQGLSLDKFLVLDTVPDLTQANVETIFSHYTNLVALLTGTVPSSSSGNILFQTNNTTRAEIQSDGDFVVDTNTFVVDATNNRIGIGTTTPSYDLSFASGSSKTIGIERSTVGAGDPLVVSSGSAATGATDSSGGDLYLKSGNSTGNKGSNIYLQTAAGGASGTTVRTPTTKVSILDSGKVGVGVTGPRSMLDVLGGVAVGTYAGSTAAPGNSLIVSGSVGIGVANPTAKLEVAGVIKSTAGGITFPDGTSMTTAAPSNLTGLGSSGDLTLTADSDANSTGEMIFATNGSERMRISNLGLLGIGVSTPTNTISLNGTDARQIGMERNTTANTAGQSLTLQAGSATLAGTNRAGGNLILQTGISTGTGESSIIFKTAAAGTAGTTDNIPQPRMTIVGNKIGIGTTPVAPFQVGKVGLGPVSGNNSSPMGFPRGYLGFPVAQEGTNFRVFGDGTNNGGSLIWGGQFGATYIASIPSTGGSDQVLTGTDVANNVKMIVNGSLVGIGGNFTPLDSIHLRGTAAEGTGMRLESTDVGGQAYQLLSTGSSDALGAGFFTIRNVSTAQDILTANSIGNFSIGGAPVASRKLFVNGDVGIASASGLYFGNTLVCSITGCTSASDERLKEDVRPLENSLEKILKLEGVSYNWINKEVFGNKKQIGFLAQDVEKVFPEVVVTNETTGFKSIAYDHLVAPLIEAFKELVSMIISSEELANKNSRQISSLNEKIAQLENENKKLMQENALKSKELDELEKRMDLFEKSLK